MPGPVRLEEIPFVESRRAGRWGGEQLSLYFLAFPTSCHLPAVPKKSLLGTRHGGMVYLEWVGHLCQGAHAAPGLCLLPPGPFLSSFSSLPFLLSLHLWLSLGPGDPRGPTGGLERRAGLMLGCSERAPGKSWSRGVGSPSQASSHALAALREPHLG